MKKLLLAVVLGLLLVAAFTTLALADNGPHGGFTATTDACASCHRAHSAQYGSNALLIMAPDLLCLSCHDGSGAGTNVVDGVYSQAGSDAHTGVAGSVVEGTDGASLFGGGFDFALMATAWSGAVTANPAFDAVSRPTTSHHNYDGTVGTVWGSGANGSVNATYALECVSCHDPHGTAGYVPNTATKVASYRILRFQPSGSGGFTAPATSVNWSGGAFPNNGGATTGWTVPDNFATNGTEWYTIGTAGAFAAGDYNAGNANNVYNLKNATASEASTYIPAAVNVAYFCAQCHDRYFNNSRLRNNTDASVYCGSPVAGTVVNGVTLTQYAPVGGVHPVDPARCEPVYTGAVITGWGDNGPSGDTTYMYRHSSGDIRTSMDGTAAAGSGATVSRSCVACHVSHGTTAQMTAFASDATLAAVAGNDVNNSVLLRMDNRSVCLRCHATTVNFTVGP
jgi:predicted CXXCH cytochrome family protein